MFRRIALALLAALLFSTAALAQTIPTSTFSGLPGSPDAGDLAWITDGNGTPTIGEPAAGGGTWRDLVAYDASQTRWEFVQRLPATAPPAAAEIAVPAERVGFDPTASGAAAVNVQAALDEAFAAVVSGHPDGTDAAAGFAIRGVDANGNHELEFDVATQPELDAHAVTSGAHHTQTLDTSAVTECTGTQSLRGDGSCAEPVGGQVPGWTFGECFTLYAPTAEIQLSDDVASVWRASGALVITEVWCETDVGTVTMDLQIDDGTPADVMGADLVCALVGVSDSSSLVGAMAVGDRLDFAITSVATAPKRLTVCVGYDYD